MDQRTNRTDWPACPTDPPTNRQGIESSHQALHLSRRKFIFYCKISSRISHSQHWDFWRHLGSSWSCCSHLRLASTLWVDLSWLLNFSLTFGLRTCMIGFAVWQNQTLLWLIYICVLRVLLKGKFCCIQRSVGLLFEIVLFIVDWFPWKMSNISHVAQPLVRWSVGQRVGGLVSWSVGWWVSRLVGGSLSQSVSELVSCSIGNLVPP